MQITYTWLPKRTPSSSAIPNSLHVLSRFIKKNIKTEYVRKIWSACLMGFRNITWNFSGLGFKKFAVNHLVALQATTLNDSNTSFYRTSFSVIQIHTNSPYTWLFHTWHFNVHIPQHAQWCVSLGKVHRMVPKWPWYVQGQKYPYGCNINPRGLNMHPFCTVMSRLRVTAQFCEKWTECLPTWPWQVQGQECPHTCSTHSRTSNVHPFHSTKVSFRVTVEFGKKCAEWPQNDLWHVQGQKYPFAYYILPWV